MSVEAGQSLSHYRLIEKIGEDDRLKVLDFGLAKLREDAQGVEAGTQFPTATVTQEGKILGTVWV